MATTQNTYTGNGSTTDYSITFEYLKDADVKVTLDHVATTAFTLPNATTLRFTTAPGNNVAIRIFRDTDVDAARFVYSAGSAIKAAELNENADQTLYGLQETANTDDITDEAVTTAKLRDGAVTTAKLGSISITTAKLADSSVTTAKIAADAINGTKIADDSINSEHYVDGSIDTAHIADAQITTAKIADDAVTTAKILDDNVTAAKLATNSVTADAIAAGAVATSELAADAVTTVKIVDDAVTTAKIAAGAVTSDSIANGTIQTEDIGDTQVTTAKLDNEAVTAAKLADNAVVTDNIVDANVTTAKIADSAVTTAKIADAELVELATMGGNTASALADLTQSEVQILDGATVTTAELNILDGVTATATELNQLDGNTLKTTGTNFTSSSQFPSASEIDARITARIDPLGGFEAIADEDSFPATAPPAGTVISIANANGLAVNSSGVGAGTRAGGSDAVVINGFPSTFNSTSLDNGIGLLVIATSTAHTYDFHRVVAKNEDVRQLSSDINDFKARYRIGSSNPTTDNDAGDLFFNTGTSKMLVYNATSSAWEEVQAVGDFFINTLSSSSGTGGGSATFNGSAYRFTLSNAPTYAQQLLVSVNGVVQKPNSGTTQPSEGFAIDGGDIILAAAPATGSNAFFITIGSSVGIGTPSDNTISTAKIIDGAVTSAKIADGTIVNADVNASAAIAGTKISPDFGSQNVVTTGSGGFGTTSPSATLHAKSGTTDVVADFESTDANAWIQIRDNSTTDTAVMVGAVGDDMRLRAGSNERVRIDSSGNVGIGKTSSGNKLEIEGQGDTKVVIDGRTDASNGSDAVLELWSKNSSGTNNFGFIDYDGDGNFEIGSGGSGAGSVPLVFKTNASERMRIDSSGNLGIGTTTITNPYSQSNFTNVNIDGTWGGIINFKLGGVEQGWIGQRSSGNQEMILGASSGKNLLFATNGNNERMRIDSSGRVGVATTPEAWSGFDVLEVNEASIASSGSGDAFFTANAYYDGAWKYKDTGVARNIYMNADGIVFRQAASGSADASIAWSERMRIASNGNVGINTTSPGAKLDVQVSNNDSIPTNANVASAGVIRIQNTNSSAVFGGIGLQARSSSSAQWLIATQWTANNQGDLVLRTRNASTTSAEIGRFLNGGGLTFNGDTATANALSDYEEGTWTPTFSSTSGSFSSVTYSLQSGHYTKIGERVYWDCRLQITAHSVGTAGGGLLVAGLPYTVNSPQGLGGNLALSNIDVPDNVVNLATEMRENTTQFYAALYTRDNSSFNNIGPSNLPSGIAEIRASGMYYTN